MITEIRFVPSTEMLLVVAKNTSTGRTYDARRLIKLPATVGTVINQITEAITDAETKAAELR